MRVALVYDRINKIGGAERVLRALHQIWPDAPLYTSVYDTQGAGWAKKIKVVPSGLNTIGFIRKHHELIPWLMPYVFESFDFNKFDVVISVTSAEAKGIITTPKTLHICYLLTPTRYLWSHAHEYAQQAPVFIKPFIGLFSSWLRVWDQVASTRPDHIVAISQTVKERTEKYYHRNVDKIIFPPVFPLSSGRRVNTQPQDYYLVVSRLVPYKRIDLAVQACNQLGRSLVVVGVGSEYEKIRKVAGDNVRMVGKLTQAQLISYYQRCKALIFPSEDDFGLVSVEAQSFGKPVIAFAKGGACETILPGKTGVLFPRQSIQSLIKAITTLETLEINAQDCRQNAHKYSWRRFKQEFADYVEEAWQNHQK